MTPLRLPNMNEYSITGSIEAKVMLPPMGISKNFMYESANDIATHIAAKDIERESKGFASLSERKAMTAMTIMSATEEMYRPTLFTSSGETQFHSGASPLS